MSWCDVHDSDLTGLVKAERRARAELNRSSSLLDLSASHEVPDFDLRRSRPDGSAVPSTAANPLSQPATVAGRGVLPSDVDVRQRRATLDVATSRQLPRMSHQVFIELNRV